MVIRGYEFYILTHLPFQSEAQIHHQYLTINGKDTAQLLHSPLRLIMTYFWRDYEMHQKCAKYPSVLEVWRVSLQASHCVVPFSYRQLLSVQCLCQVQFQAAQDSATSAAQNGLTLMCIIRMGGLSARKVVLLFLLEAYLLTKLMLFQYCFNKQLLKNSYLTFTKQAIKNHHVNKRLQKTLQEGVCQSRLHGKVYSKTVAVRRIQSCRKAGGLGQQHLLKKSAASTKTLKYTCASLKATLSSYFFETCVVRTLHLCAWWLHPVPFLVGSYWSRGWTGGSNFNLLSLGTSQHGKKQHVMTCMSFYFCGLICLY